jgi:hypothetical protein
MEKSSVVLFIHGYGAINPMIFGAWIEHLVLQGNIVIYPRYQHNLILPSTDRFTPLVANAYVKALGQLKNVDPDFDVNKLVIVGHSYGGVIAANIAVEHEKYDIQKPDAVFTCEPGHGPLTGGVLQSYSQWDPSVPVVIMVGDKDWTVGDEFGKRLFNELPEGHPKVLLRQVEVQYDTLRLTASHYEPYAIDPDFDNENRNLTFKRALKMGKINAIDYFGYWKILDQLLTCSLDQEDPCISEFAQGWDLGFWPDTEVPIEAIKVEKYSPSSGKP